MNYKKAKNLDRYTIFAPGRIKRPEQTELSGQNQCPICPENIDREKVLDIIGAETDWKVMSVKNKFPIVDNHEVIIHSPDHNLKIEEMSDEQAGVLIQMYYRRYIALRDKGQVVIFCNFGKFAGASLEHPHSQIMVINKEIKIEHLESDVVEGLIKEEDGFKVFTPEYSEFPYEVWVKSSKIFESFGTQEFLKTGKLLKEVVGILIAHLSEISLLDKHSGKSHLHWKDYGVAYNFYLNTEGEFYIRIIPKLSIQAGFELATGVNVNVADPLEVAKLLKIDINE